MHAQQSLKRQHFHMQLRRGTFITNEPEYFRLAEFAGLGDWVIDIGANVGHYTCSMAQTVGPEGRVFSFEPIPESFELLASNVAFLNLSNVTLINAAASTSMQIVGMCLPSFDNGLRNFYQASITDQKDVEGYRVAAFSLDSFCFSHRIALIKIDAEGHEREVLAGMESLLVTYGPVLIVEGRDYYVEKFLVDRGYSYTQRDDSPNRVYIRTLSEPSDPSGEFTAQLKIEGAIPSD